LFNTWGGLDSNPGRQASIYSPDRKKVVHINNEKATIAIDGKPYQTRFGDKTNAELGWAPDSSRFFLTWTDGGTTGTWHVQIYAVAEAGLKEIKGIERPARNDFARRIRRLPVPKDFAEEPLRGFWLSKEYCEPNAVASEWVNGSKELLISVLVPNVGICRHMSEFNVYRIEIPSGRILQRYTAKEAHQKFNPANLPRIAD
jgi:hypothetical protein